jgi:hypothetical protein
MNLPFHYVENMYNQLVKEHEKNSRGEKEQMAQYSSYMPNMNSFKAPQMPNMSNFKVPKM